MRILALPMKICCKLEDGSPKSEDGSQKSEVKSFKISKQTHFPLERAGIGK